MQKIKNFIVESIEEMKNKVSWPEYSQLQNSSVLVLIASMVFALLIGAFDYVFEATLEWFYKQF